MKAPLLPSSARTCRMMPIIAISFKIFVYNSLQEESIVNYSAPLNIAHRGARSLAPENTIAAARRAVEIGADLWELDVAMTADGELVILHDDTLERTSNVEQVYPDRRPWALHTFTLEEVRRLDFGSWFNEQDPFKQIASGNVTPEMQQSYVNEPIPTLREALVFTRDHDWRVNVEIKDAPGIQEIDGRHWVEKVVALIDELGMNERVLISSFNHGYLSRVKAANPALATAPLVGIPAEDAVGLVRSLNAQEYNPGWYRLNPEEIPAIRQAGIGVNVWTVNNPEMMQVLIQHGASGIITDFPQLMVGLKSQIKP